MKRILVLTTIASVLGAGFALAGLNPEYPMLPDADAYGMANIPNNQGSAMCVDCHSRIPQTVGGTHFVTATGASDTNSSGGWAAGAGRVATNRMAAEAGLYFKYNGVAWSSGGFSKYFDGTNSLISPAAAVDVGDDNVLTEPVDNVALPDYWTSIQGGADPSAYDLICESCHSIIVNVAGGNNLLELPLDVACDIVASAEATMCVGCHGFMYNSTPIALQPANPGTDVNYGDVRNDTNGDGTGTRRDNNEDHYIAGTLYSMNHHVTQGDDISSAKISAGYGWRDVTAFSLADAPMNINNTLGQYPVDGDWAPDKYKGGFNCLNCHTMAHGAQGGVLQAPILLGASILRDEVGDVGGDAATAIERLSDGTRTWFGFQDAGYCNNCHHLPTVDGGTVVTP